MSEMTTVDALHFWKHAVSDVIMRHDHRAAFEMCGLGASRGKLSRRLARRLHLTTRPLELERDFPTLASLQACLGSQKKIELGWLLHWAREVEAPKRQKSAAAARLSLADEPRAAGLERPPVKRRLPIGHPLDLPGLQRTTPK